jgi:PAS domain S-box-containing protein
MRNSDPQESQEQLELQALRRRVAALESREGERRQAEERAAGLGRILDDSLNEIYVFDAETLHCTQANRGARENLGYALAALLNLTPLDLMPGLTPEDLRALLEPLHSGQEDRIRFTTHHRRRDGSRYPVEVDLQLSHSGASKEFVAIALDITEREKAVEALRDSEERTRAILETAVEGIITIDEHGAIESLNASAGRMFGYEPGELVGSNVRVLMPPPFREEHDGYLRRYRETGERRIIGIGREVVGLRKGGEQFPLHISVGELRLRNRRLFTAVLRDLTQDKQSEEELRRTQRQLLQAQKLEAIGQLAGGIAHDFNNYLTVILGNVELLAPDLPEEGTPRQVLGEIEKAGRQSAALTQQLLAFSRAQVLEPRVVDLNRIVSGVEAMLERILGEDIDLHFETETKLEPVLVDPSQLEQVIVNLAVNARDAMPKGGTLSLVTGDVYLDEEFAAEHQGIRPGRHAMLAVTDTGTGMDQGVLSQIFEPFFTTKGKDRGTGLGLSTVFGILKQSGGSISVESELERGTTFRIYLPLVEAEENPELLTAGPADLPRGSETILLAEDQEMVRRVTRAFLEAQGYAVVEAEDGRSALAVLESGASHFDLLIADVIMPQMGGVELAARARDREPGLRVLLMSGYAEPALAHQGEYAPGTALLKKPFTARELLGKVSLALHG